MKTQSFENFLQKVFLFEQLDTSTTYEMYMFLVGIRDVRLLSAVVLPEFNMVILLPKKVPTSGKVVSCSWLNTDNFWL